MTPQEAITELRAMQRQIIHGSSIFGDIANIIDGLYSALTDANEQCRSAAEIAKRSGVATNWPAHAYALGESLKRQHAVLSPPNDQALT